MNAGPGESTYLFNRMPGISDSVFVRYYIKYDNTSSFHHSGVWMGGNNPPTNWPNVHAGYRPAGDSAFHIGTEVRGTTQNPANSSVFGFYNYWTGMHISTQNNPNTGTPYYWGNQFLSSDPNAIIDMSSWNCIEVMVKLNNLVSETSGELALWINGNKIAHYGAGFPNGTWNQDFTEGAGTRFDGFQWRTDTALQFNYIWLTSYVTNNALNHVANVYYDHVVVAKNYIGPIAAGSLALNEEKSIVFSAFPNPADQTLHFSKELEGVKITNAIGQIIYQSDEKTTVVSTRDFKPGMYFLSSSAGNMKFNVNR